jgi:hypothetical protein
VVNKEFVKTDIKELLLRRVNQIGGVWSRFHDGLLLITA